MVADLLADRSGGEAGVTPDTDKLRELAKVAAERSILIEDMDPRTGLAIESQALARGLLSVLDANELLLADRDRAEAYWKEIAVGFKAERDEALGRVKTMQDSLRRESIRSEMAFRERDRLAGELREARRLLSMLEYDGDTIPGPVSWPSQRSVIAALAGVPGEAAQEEGT